MADPLLEILADGEQPSRSKLQRLPQFTPLYLRNDTGAATDVGDVVAFSTASDGAVVAYDQYLGESRYAVCMERIAAGASGIYGRGFVSVRVTGGNASPGAHFVKSDTALSVEQLVTSNAGIDGRPAFTLGYFTGSLDSSGLAAAYFHGDPSDKAYWVTESYLADDFYSLDIDANAAPGAGVVVRGERPYGWTGASPTADQGHNGRATLAGDGVASPGSFFLLKEWNSVGPTFTPATPFLIDAASRIVMRFQVKQKGAGGAATRRLGLMTTFAAAAPANGVYLEWADGANITLVVRNATAQDTQTLTVPMLTSDFYSIMIRIYKGNTARVIINGTDQGVFHPSVGMPTVPLGFGHSVSVATAGIGSILDRYEVLQDRRTNT